jgi:acetyl-CoA carboxylase beta subunit
MIDGHKIAIAVMDFSFCRDDGFGRRRKNTRTIEYGYAQRSAVIIVAASGGARCTKEC